MKYLAPVASQFILLICVVWSFHLRDPHLLPIRNYEAWVVVSLTFVLLVLARKIKNTHLKRMQIASSVCLVLFAGFSEYQFHSLKERLLNNPSVVEEKINQRLIIGFRDYEEIEKLSLNGIGGIFLTRRNIENITSNDLKQKIEKLQAGRMRSGLPPLLVATDQEGGTVSRLSPLVDYQPPLRELALEWGATTRAFDYGYEQGRQLQALGVNVNFSPVVDLQPLQATGALDFHTRIHARAISAKPETVISIAGAYIKGLNAAGVTATLKHFPGLMRVEGDTHHFSANLNTSVSVLEHSDWLPFLQLSRLSNSWIMLSHVVLKEVDPENPVSTSRLVVTKVLRQQIGFEGVLITDDLTMGATYNVGFCKSVRSAYDSDIDYLLIAYDYEKYYAAVDCINSAEDVLIKF